MNRKQERRLKNWKELYASVQVDIKVASEQLVLLFKKIKQREKEIAGLDTKLSEVVDFITEIDQEKKSMCDWLGEMRKKFLEQKEELNRKIEDYNEALKRYTIREDKWEARINDIRETEKSLEQNIIDLHKKDVGLMKERDGLIAKLDRLSETEKIKRTELEKLIKEKTAIIEQKQAREKDLTINLEKIKSKISEEQQKVGLAKVNLLKFKEDLSIREKDLLVVETRLRRYFNELGRVFPSVKKV